MQRELRLLNREWKFVHQERDVNQLEDVMLWTDIGLPHSFGIPYFMENEFYIGHGSYVKDFVLSDEDIKQRILLEFLGSFQVTEVYLNDLFVGRHRGGYTAFAFDITKQVRVGENRLFVKVNNLWDKTIAPRGGEHQFNGGIYRDVQLILTNHLCVERHGTFVTTKNLSEDAAIIGIETTLYLGAKEANGDGNLILESIAYYGEERIASESKKVDSKIIRQEMAIQKVHKWTPESPALYRLESVLREGEMILDYYDTTFGIRTLRFDKDQGFFLNEKHYEIIGANAHQDHAGWGDAVTRAGITRDIQMIKDCGMNMIRGSHYPHHPFYADECDRIGLLFWGELCFWGTAGPKLDGYWHSSAYPIREEDEAEFEKNCFDTLKEMIWQNRNNPSIFTWSVSNEPFFSAAEVMDKARDFVSRLVDKVHELDPTRPASVGGAQREGFDVLGDVAGYNGDGASLYIDPGFPNFVSEYGSMVSFRPGEFSPNYTDNAGETYSWRSGKALWCAFHHGSIIGDMGAMGMIDYYRIPLNTWHWYRKELRGIPYPTPRKEGIPAKIRLTSDRTEITTNGTEDAYLYVEILDKEDTPLANELPVTLTVVEGDGIFPTGKSITFSPKDKSLLDGQAAIEFRSYYGGTNVIEATGEGLEGASVTIEALGAKRLGELIPMVPPPYLTPQPVYEEMHLLSKNKPVFSDSFCVGYEPSHVTMEDENYWKPKNNEGGWLTIDLEGIWIVRQIEIEFVEADSAPHFMVGLSEDNRTFREVTLTFANGRYIDKEQRYFRFLKVALKPAQEGIRAIRLWTT